MSGPGVVTLEIALRLASASTTRSTTERAYALTLRSSLDGQSWQDPLVKASPRSLERRVTINTELLLSVSSDERTYGRQLSSMVFKRKLARAAYEKAYATAEATKSIFQILLWFDPNDTILPDLRWECMCDPRFPDRAEFLATNRRIALVRYHSSSTAQWRQPGEPRALIVAASPQKLDTFKLDPFPAAEHSARLEQLLSSSRTVERQVLLPMQVDLLASADQNGSQGSVSSTRPSSFALIEKLRVSKPALIYIMCHGAFAQAPADAAKASDAGPCLILEQEDGTPERVDAARIATYLRTSEWAPDLVVLASCESAGAGHNSRALAALAPRLLEAGIMMVVAMHGRIESEAAVRFSEVFFDELRLGRPIGFCVAEARAQLLSANDPHWWRPALFSRLENGAARPFMNRETTRRANAAVVLVRGEAGPAPWVAEYHGIIDRSPQIDYKKREHCHALLNRIAELLRSRSPSEQERQAFAEALDELDRNRVGFYYQLLKRIQRPPHASDPAFAFSYRREAARRVSASGS